MTFTENIKSHVLKQIELIKYQFIVIKLFRENY